MVGKESRRKNLLQRFLVNKMSDKVKPRHQRNPRFYEEEGLIAKNEPRKDKRDKRKKSGKEWKRERESM